MHPFLIWSPLLAFIVSCAGTYWLSHDLKRKGQFDPTLPRSSHERLVPRGGGLALISSFILIAAFAGMDPVVLGLAGVLVAISWMDDKKGVHWQYRLLVQCFVIGMTLAVLWSDGVLLSMNDLVPHIPFVIFLTGIAFIYLWYVNQFNFTDGIDGLASAQAVITCGGCAVYFLCLSGATIPGFAALTLGAAALGFFIWNYPPARIFMGDSGSIPLGYLTGYFLLLLSASGGWGLALSLPLWLFADASMTICRRIIAGHSPLAAHRDHYYQRAAGRTVEGHRKVMQIFISLQILHCLTLGACLYFMPQQQWLLPVISTGFAIAYFTWLNALAKARL